MSIILNWEHITSSAANARSTLSCKMSCHSTVFSLSNIRVNSLKVMTTLNEFLQFVRLPIELQLLVFQFAFHLSPTRSHTPLLITPSTALSKVLRLKHDYLNRPISSADCEPSTWPRVAPIPRNWLIHDKNIYSSHGSSEWKIYLRSNSCVEGECCSVKHIRIKAVEAVCLGRSVRAGANEDEIEGHGESEADDQGYRIVMVKKEGLAGLLHACTLSRLAALEEWRALLTRRDMRKMEREHYEAVDCAPHDEGTAVECASVDGGKKRGGGKREMVLDVIGKMLDEH